MKKLLALVLALVMTMGLATVGTSAAYSDAASIEHTEAVEVLTALEVVGGRDGAYDPTANVKRSEMAKMVTIAVLGNVDVSAFQGAPTDLTDINGHWAEGYMKYCYSQGIIGGRGNGKFEPDANVTATEAAKMLLVAIGYNADVQGYGGDQWKVNVVRDAQLSRFYTGLGNLSVDKALTRDETAQLVYNAMDADLIERTPALNVTTGQLTYSYKPYDDHRDLLGETFKAYSVEGRLDKFSYTSKDAKWSLTIKNTTGSAQTNVKGFSSDTFAANVTQAFDSTTDYTGLYKQDVKVLYTLDKNDRFDKAVGVYPTTQNEVLVTHVIGKIDQPNATAKQVKIDGVNYELTNTAAATPIYELKHNDDTATGSVLANTVGGYIAAADANDPKANNQAVKSTYLFNLIDNDDDGKGDLIVVFPASVAKVTNLSSSSVAVSYKLNAAGNTAKTFQLKDTNTYNGIAKDDYVVVTLAANSPTNTDTLTKAELQTATVTATRSSEEQLNGAWLKSTFVDAAKAGDSVNYVAYNGFLAYQEGASGTGAEKFVVVLGHATSNDNKIDNTYTTKLLFSDGTKKTVEVKKVNNTAGASGAANIWTNRMYGYKMDGDNYLLYDVNSTYVSEKSATGTYEFKTSYEIVGFNETTSTYVYANTSGVVGTLDTTGEVARINANGVYTIADDAVVFVYRGGDDATVTTGAQLKKLAESETVNVMFLAADKNSSTGYNEVKFAYIDTAVKVKSTYAFTVADPQTRKNDSGKWVTELTVWNGTAITTLTTEAKDSTTGNIVEYASKLGNKAAFSYELNASGEITSIKGYLMDGSTTGASGEPANNFGVKAVAVTGYAEGQMISVSNKIFTKASGTNTITYTSVYTTYTYQITKDTDIFYVNFGTSPVSGETSGSTVAVADEEPIEYFFDNGNATMVNIANAVIVPDSTNPGEVALIVVDLSGDILGIRGK